MTSIDTHRARHSTKTLTDEVDGFVRQARCKPQRYPVVSRGFETTHGGRSPDVMSTFGWKTLPVLALTLFVAMTPASAQNLGFMKDAPIASFTDQDMQLFKQTLSGVLDGGTIGEARSWSNPDTKARGEVTAIKSFEREAVPCRRVAVKNWAKGRSASGQYSFCKQASGQWAAAS